MYLSPVPFEELDFPTFRTEPVTALSESVATYGTAGVAASVTLLLGGLYYWFHRQQGDILVDEPTVGENEQSQSAPDALEGES